jgi:hypothetical protein
LAALSGETNGDTASKKNKKKGKTGDEGKAENDSLFVDDVEVCLHLKLRIFALPPVLSIVSILPKTFFTAGCSGTPTTRTMLKN